MHFLSKTVVYFDIAVHNLWPRARRSLIIRKAAIAKSRRTANNKNTPGVHSQGYLSGSYQQSLQLTDKATGWPGGEK